MLATPALRRAALAPRAKNRVSVGTVNGKRRRSRARSAAPLDDMLVDADNPI
jgi:hypothetical protein